MTIAMKALSFKEVSPQCYQITVQEESRNAVNMLVDYLEIVGNTDKRHIAVMLDMCSVNTLPVDQFVQRAKLSQSKLDYKTLPYIKLAIVYQRVTPFVHAASSFMRNLNPSKVTVHFYDCNASYQAWDWLNKN